MQTVKVGVLGCGRIAELHHLPAFQSDPAVKIVAIADIDKSHLARVSRKFHVKQCYTDYNDLLQKENDIDAVSICLPTYLHREAVIATAEARKHILCEKPMARRVDGALQMIRAAEKNGVNFYIGYCLRFAKVYELLKKHINSGFIGEPLKIAASLSTPLPKEEWYFDRDKGGGVLFDTGPHMIDLLTWIFGNVKVASAHFTQYANKPEVNVESLLGLTFSNGLSASLEVIWHNTNSRLPASRCFVRVEGSKGTLSADFFESTILIHKRESVMGRFTKGVKLAVDQGSPVFWKEIWEFVDNLRVKNPSNSLATGRDGLNCLKLVLEAFKLDPAQKRFVEDT